MKKERWKPIWGYTGLYEVSDLGRIRGVERWCNHRHGKRFVSGKVLKMGKNEYGYVIVNLSKRNALRCFRVARLVAKAFIPNPLRFREVNHKRGNKEDNRASQLEWTSRSKNMKHCYRIGLRKSSKYA